MIWRAYLASHDGPCTEWFRGPPDQAVAHFRVLLGRVDLLGRRFSAALGSPVSNSLLYSSRFDRELGEGRIHPDAPTDPFRLEPGTREATAWRPPARVPPIADPRPLPLVLRDVFNRPGRPAKATLQALGWTRSDLRERLEAEDEPADGRAIRALLTLMEEGRA